MPELVKDLTENWWYEYFSGKNVFSLELQVCCCPVVDLAWKEPLYFEKKSKSLLILQLWIVPS